MKSNLLMCQFENLKIVKWKKVIFELTKYTYVQNYIIYLFIKFCF